MSARQADVAAILDRIDVDLQTLQSAADSASPEMQGLLVIIATRVHSLITIALQIPPDTMLP